MTDDRAELDRYEDRMARGDGFADAHDQHLSLEADALEERDRLWEKGGEPWRMYARRPHERERELHRMAA